VGGVAGEGDVVVTTGNYDYLPYVAKFGDGRKVLVTIQTEQFVDERDCGADLIVSVELAFRDLWATTWGPPIQLERAP
jgi:hypothetical protein